MCSSDLRTNCTATTAPEVLVVGGGGAGGAGGGGGGAGGYQIGRASCRERV